MTLQEAKTLVQGDYIHSVFKKNSDGTPMRAKVTSIKTWKRNPEKVEVRYKRGMWEFGCFRECDLNQIEKGYGC